MTDMMEALMNVSKHLSGDEIEALRRRLLDELPDNPVDALRVASLLYATVAIASKLEPRHAVSILLAAIDPSGRTIN